jgi:hypothetical protein
MDKCLENKKRHEYNPIEVQVLYKIHEASFRTALPLVIATLTHISDSIHKGEAEEGELISKVRQDPLLIEVGCSVNNDSIIKEIIKNLIDQDFIEREGDKLKLTKCGNKAAKILNLS